MSGWKRALAVGGFAALIASGTAQAQTSLRVAQGQQPQQQAQPAPPPPPPQPFRTEILNFDNWNVTCRDFAQGKRRHICFAALEIVQQKTNQVVFTWTIGYDDENKPVTTLQTPSGVVIAPGVELKMGKATRTVPFITCEPGRCTASTVMDAALMREFAGAANVAASIRASGGNTIRFDIPMKGYDKAFAALK